jgi:ATP-dependent RNA helicase DeaD
MRDGRARVCVATDVAARGIDLPNLDLVIHADMPSKPDTLLHRSGRTGRAGRKGVCVLIVPVRRYSAALRVLNMANVTATTRNAPTQVEIDARYRAHILDAAANAAPPSDSEAALVRELLSRVSPEQLAAAYLRQQFDHHPKAAYISETPLPTPFSRGKDRGIDKQRTKAGTTRSLDREDMTGAGWFSLSLGRKHRADPKWLLPMICKAGGITKRDVGSIKIFDTETRFEITSHKVADFAAKLARDGSGEKGVTIALLHGSPRDTGAQAPASKREKRERFEQERSFGHEGPVQRTRQREKPDARTHQHERAEQRPRRSETLYAHTADSTEKARPHQPQRLIKPWKKSKPQAGHKGGPKGDASHASKRDGDHTITVKPWSSSGSKGKNKKRSKA